MPPGEWSKNKTKSTDARVQAMAAKVSQAHRDPALRKRLDDQKRLGPDQVSRLIAEAQSRWTVLTPLSEYTRRIDRNLRATCPAGHEGLVSLQDVQNNIRCRTCEPKKNAGSKNHAYVDLREFTRRLIDKHSGDAFRFDAGAYSGVNAEIEFECTQCLHTFTKAPRVLLFEKIGCPRCANAARSNSQRRTEAEFLKLAREVWGDLYTYHPAPNQRYGNSDYVSRTCNACNVTDSQLVPSLLFGNGCSTCSQKKKHTTESFIARAQAIWGTGEFDYSQVAYVNNKHLVTLKCKKGHVFQCSPSNHMSKRGCPDCATKKFVSAGETEWLDALNIPPENRNVWLRAGGQKFNADGFINGTVYEYYGDYWHGNPDRFPPDLFNVKARLTMKELYDHTIEREQLIRDAGYIVIHMWENDWMKLRKTRRSA